MSSPSQSRSVRRADLVSRASSEEPSSPHSTLETRFREQLQQLYAEDHTQGVSEDVEITHKSRSSNIDPAEDNDGLAYDFRLFARSSGAGPLDDQERGLQKIVLRSPTPVNGEPGFMKPQRSERYYFTGVPSAIQNNQFYQAAISGERVLESQNMRWPGHELPWRVTVISATGRAQAASPVPITQEISVRRKRNGKKRRIIIRKRIEAKKATQSAAEQKQAEKEATERQKRTKRNREKKVKRKEKEKSKKAQSAADDGGIVDSG